MGEGMGEGIIVGRGETGGGVAFPEFVEVVGFGECLPSLTESVFFPTTLAGGCLLLEPELY